MSAITRVQFRFNTGANSYQQYGCIQDGSIPLPPILVQTIRLQSLTNNMDAINTDAMNTVAIFTGTINTGVVSYQQYGCNQYGCNLYGVNQEGCNILPIEPGETQRLPAHVKTTPKIRNGGPARTPVRGTKRKQRVVTEKTTRSCTCVCARA